MNIDEITNRILRGDVFAILPSLPDNFVDCIISSPPYWGLREYPGKKIVLGGVANCSHEWIFIPAINRSSPGDVPSPGSAASHRDNETVNRPVVSSDICNKCGAWKGQFGQEPTVALYIEHTILLMREFRRILKNTGSLWWNIADSYARNGGAGGNWNEGRRKKAPKWRQAKDPAVEAGLVALPERYVVAMTDAGWQRPNSIIWHKESCFPYSGGNRFTVDFEYIHWFVQDYKQYYFNQQMEPAKTSTKPAGKRLTYGGVKKSMGNPQAAYTNNTYRGDAIYKNDGFRNMRTTWDINTSKCKDTSICKDIEHYATFPDVIPAGASKRKDIEHYATFPEEIPERIIDATCPKSGFVMDPFSGSGTTLAVAKRMGRSFIGIELFDEYADYAERRIENTSVSRVKNETIQSSLFSGVV